MSHRTFLFLAAAETFLSAQSGKSMSEITHLKDENSNKNAAFANKVKVSMQKDLFRSDATIFITGSAPSTYTDAAQFQIKPEDFDEVIPFTERYVQSSWYGEAIKMKKALIDEIEGSSVEKIAEVLEITIPKGAGLELPKKKTVFASAGYSPYIKENLATAEKIEKIIPMIGKLGMPLVSHLIRKALELEANVVHIATFCRKEGSFLQMLNKAPETLPTIDTDFPAGKKITKFTLAYKPEDYKPTFEDLIKKHENAQKEFNAIVTEIKTLLTEAEIAFDKQYSLDYSKYNTQATIDSREYQEFQDKMTVIKSELLNEAGKLFIIE